MLTPPYLGYGHRGGEEFHTTRLPRVVLATRWRGAFRSVPPSLHILMPEGVLAPISLWGESTLHCLPLGGVGGGKLPLVQDDIFILQHVRLQKMGRQGWGDW